MPAKTIMIVEDEQDVRDTLKELLSLAGYEITAAATGAEGLRHGAGKTFDVAIIDLKLPDQSGLEVGRKLAQKRPRPYLIAYSGWSPQEYSDQVRAAGFDVYLVKPVPVETLLDVIRRAIT